RVRARRARVPASRHANLHVAEARGGCAVRDAHRLAGLALAAVGEPPEPPFGLRADRVEAAPELGRPAAVARVAHEAAPLAVDDLPADLGGELELEPARVDRPRAVRVEVEAAFCRGDQVVERARV